VRRQADNHAAHHPQMLCRLWPHSSIIPDCSDCIIAHQAFLKGVGLFFQTFIYYSLVLSHYCTSFLTFCVVLHILKHHQIVWLLYTRLRANHALQQLHALIELKVPLKLSICTFENARLLTAVNQPTATSMQAAADGSDAKYCAQHALT